MRERVGGLTIKIEKDYFNVKFSPEIINQAIEQITSKAAKNNLFNRSDRYHISIANQEIRYDNIDEFYSDYIKNIYRADIIIFRHNIDLDLSYKRIYNISNEKTQFGTSIGIKAVETKNNRQTIEQIFNIFEDAKEKYTIPEPLAPPEPPEEPEPAWESKVKIFIGHGGKPDWEKLKNHLADKHDFEVVAYETGARAGHEIRDVLEEMLDKATYAILVFTGENPDSDGKMHARENVIHELGLFQGKLGHKKTIVLLEKGVEKFSNIDGVQYLPYPEGHIDKTFGDVLATIKREFKPK